MKLLTYSLKNKTIIVPKEQTGVLPSLKDLYKLAEDTDGFTQYFQTYSLFAAYVEILTKEPSNDLLEGFLDRIITNICNECTLSDGESDFLNSISPKDYAQVLKNNLTLFW